MPDPRPRPRYRLALIGVFAAFSLALVALGVRLGTASIIGGADRGPADAGIEPAGAIVELGTPQATPEPGLVAAEPLGRPDAPRTDAATQEPAPRAQVVPPAAGTAASPAPQEPAAALPVPAPAPGPVPQPTAPVTPPPADSLLAPVAPVLDALLGGSGGTTPTLPGV